MTPSIVHKARLMETTVTSLDESNLFSDDSDLNEYSYEKDDPEKSAINNIEIESLNKAINELDEVDQLIVKAYFGLGSEFEGKEMTYDEIASLLVKKNLVKKQMTKQSIYARLSQILVKLKNLMMNN